MEDELIQLQLQLRDSGRTKDTVQSGYDELTKEVEAKTLQHKEEMADLQLRLADGKKSSEDLSQRVSGLASLQQLRAPPNKGPSRIWDTILSTKDHVSRSQVISACWCTCLTSEEKTAKSWSQCFHCSIIIIV